MDKEQYSEAAQCVQHQMDTFESLNVPLTEDYVIDNIAITIINISNAYKKTKTVVNTMRNNYHPQSQNKYNNTYCTKQNPNSDFNQCPSPKYQSKKFDQASCFVCEQSGHVVTHCCLLQKIWAIMQFKMKYCDKCDTILQQHIRNNTDESKRLFVCTLQNMSILLQTDDLDSYFDHDMIVHTMTNNCIDNNYLHSDDE